MALQKNITLKTGVVATYTRIKSITKNIDLDRGIESIVMLEHYLTNDTTKSPVELSQEHMPVVYSFAEAYTVLKTLEKYAGAGDC
jgi:hypothetical protein